MIYTKKSSINCIPAVSIYREKNSMEYFHPTTFNTIPLLIAKSFKEPFLPISIKSFFYNVWNGLKGGECSV